MQDKPVALVTGANQGIGLQIAKDWLRTASPSGRFAQSRRGGRGGQDRSGDARALQLDVTDEASIAAAAERIREEFGRLDVLVNNAAISNRASSRAVVEDYAKTARPSVVSLEEMRAVWETNVFGVLAVTQAMLPLLREAPAARIVNVSSGVGSLTTNATRLFLPLDLRPRLPRSKTALNAMTLAMAMELESRGIKVNAVCPGFTKTNLNAMRARRLSRRARARRCASRCSARTARRALLGRNGTIPW